MRLLTLTELTQTNESPNEKDVTIWNVCGGFIPALVALITIVTVPLIIHDSAKKYNSIGHQLGEAAWEHFHPYDPNK